MLAVSAWGHACVSIDAPDGSIVIDPGSWASRAPLGDCAAILITHSHGDHVEIESVVAAVRARPDVSVVCPLDVAEDLFARHVDRSQVTIPVDGQQLRIAGLDVSVHASKHGVIHESLEHPENFAFMVGGAVLHPGDSVEVKVPGAAVLLLPVGGPWLALGQAIELARRVAPKFIVPIHDAVLSASGRQLADHLVGALVPGSTYSRLAVGERLVVDEPGD